MIIYFSGTGNSKFAADYLADKLGDSTLSLNDIIRNNKQLVCSSEKPYIIVAPIYAWRLPHIIEETIKSADLKGSNTVYCVATMGENSGNADRYIEKIILGKGMCFSGFAGVPMQNNYLLMEVMPDRTIVMEGLHSAAAKLDSIAAKIKNGDRLCKDDKTPLPSLMSGAVNWGFNRFMLKNQKYSVNEKCTACGKCSEICPVNNITVQNNTVVFNDRCMACFACLHRCPMQAINIEGKTEDKGRYICPEYSEWKVNT